MKTEKETKISLFFVVLFFHDLLIYVQFLVQLASCDAGCCCVAFPKHEDFWLNGQQLLMGPI